MFLWGKLNCLFGKWLFCSSRSSIARSGIIRIDFHPIGARRVAARMPSMEKAPTQRLVRVQQHEHKADHDGHEQQNHWKFMGHFHSFDCANSYGKQWHPCRMPSSSSPRNPSCASSDALADYGANRPVIGCKHGRALGRDRRHRHWLSSPLFHSSFGDDDDYGLNGGSFSL